MKCEKCGKNEATMYYKETVNGVTREMHLCPECAQKENLGGAFENAFQSMNHFWSDPFHSFLGGGFGSLWNDMLGEAAPTATMLGTERKCPTCGMTESELRRTGRVAVHAPQPPPGKSRQGQQRRQNGPEQHTVRTFSARHRTAPFSAVERRAAAHFGILS